jgi:hypothetical protein
VKQAPEWVLAVVPAKPGLAWALVALPGKLGLAWALAVVPAKPGLAWALVVAPAKPGLVWVLAVVLAKLGLALVLAVVPGKREPAWVWGLVTPGPVSGLDRPCRKLSLSQMGFRFPKQRSHLCTRISGLAKNLIGPSGSRFRIEIAAEHHHQIYKFANISSAGDSIRGRALNSILDRFRELRLACGLALSREELVEMHKHPAFELLHFYS